MKMSSEEGAVAGLQTVYGIPVRRKLAR